MGEYNRNTGQFNKGTGCWVIIVLSLIVWLWIIAVFLWPLFKGQYL